MSQSKYFQEIHTFRAVAILLIVAAHAWVMPILKYTNDFSVVPELSWLNSIVQALFHGTTLLFALISGMLFSLALRTKTIKAFYISKVLYVALPYILMSFLYVFIWWLSKEGESVDFLLTKTFDAIKKGSAHFHFWYIPILLFLYLITPVLDKLLELIPIYVIWGICLIPLIVTRTWPYLSWSTTVYFLGAYFFGMYVGQYYKLFYTFMSKHLVYLLLALIVTTTVVMLIYQYDIKKAEFISVNESVIYVQKIIMGLVILYYINRYFFNEKVVLNKVADYAFGIYFLHIIFLMSAIAFLKEKGLLDDNPWYMFGLGFGLFFYSLIIPMICIAILRGILGKRSRYIIGS